jgi:hypothetical protein
VRHPSPLHLYGVLNLDFSVNIVLATVKDGQPYARYHVHRGFVVDAQGLDTEYLYTTTDLEMPKGLRLTGSYALSIQLTSMI